MPKENIKRSANKTINKDYLYLIQACIFILILTFSLFNLSYYLFKTKRNYFFYDKPTKVLAKTTVDDWESFLKENPSYQEGYLVLVKLYLHKGDIKEAERLLEIAKNLNPNSQKLKKLLEENN